MIDSAHLPEAAIANTHATKANPCIWTNATQAGGLILVVDDDKVLVKLVSTMLQKEGFRVITAPDVATAVRNVGRAHPLLILLDINLPDGTGLDVLRQIRKLITGRIPVIAMSSTCTASVAEAAGEAGAAAFFAKPLNFDELWPTMNRLLGNDVTFIESAAAR